MKEENQTIIKAINMFGRVPEQYELLEEIEKLNKESKILRENAEHNDKVVDKVNWENKRLNNIINELEKWLDKKEKLTFNSWNKGIHEVQRKLQELKGDDKNGKS